MSNRTASWLLLATALAFHPPALAQSSEPQPLTLRRAVELALARAPELAISRARADEGNASARLAGDAFHPEAFATTTPGYATGLPVAVAGRVPAIAGVEVRQTLYNTGRKSEALEARARAASLAGALERTRAETTESVVVAYARAFMDRARLEVARRRLRAEETILSRVTALRREGRQTDLDVERTALQVARAKQRLVEAESDRDLNQLILRRLVDWPANTPLLLAEDPLSALPEPAPGENFSTARARDPQLRAFDEQLESLRRVQKLQSRRWSPVIEAEAQYSRLSRANNFDEFYLKFKADDFSVGVSLALPLWTGGRLAEAKARATANLDRVEAERRIWERDLELDVRRAEAAADRATAEMALAGRAAGVAQEGLRLARLLAQEGRGEVNALESQEIAAADAEEEMAKATVGVLAARARLLDLRGELPSAVLGTPASSPEPGQPSSRSETPL